MTFGMKLRTLRESKGLSQKALADLVGVQQSSIGRYETGDQVPSFETVLALCEAMAVDCNSFAGCDFKEAKKKRGRGRPKNS